MSIYLSSEAVTVTDAKPVYTGDIALVHDDKPQGFGMLAKVVDTVAGCDGRIRGAVLKTSSSTGRPSTLRLPLQLLYPLEIRSCEGECSEVQTNDNPSDGEPHSNQPDDMPDDGDKGELPGHHYGGP